MFLNFFLMVLEVFDHGKKFSRVSLLTFDKAGLLVTIAVESGVIGVSQLEEHRCW